MTKFITTTLLGVMLLSSSVQAFGLFHGDINQQIEYDEQRIKEYQKAIKKLEKEIKYLKSEKKKNPELYVKKPLFENLKDKYLYRIKLNGAKMDALNFVIKDNSISISMNIKNEQKDNQGYFFSSRHFARSFTIPANVNQEKITNRMDGDYFLIEMPKKK